MRWHVFVIIKYWQLKLESSQSEKICDFSKSEKYKTDYFDSPKGRLGIGAV